MKLYITLTCILSTLAFASCKKCETCVPYFYGNGSLGAKDSLAQSVKLCDERDIKSYENLTTFTDRFEDTVRFICK
jgi:hypothetical protein